MVKRKTKSKRGKSAKIKVNNETKNKELSDDDNIGNLDSQNETNDSKTLCQIDEESFESSGVFTNPEDSSKITSINYNTLDITDDAAGMKTSADISQIESQPAENVNQGDASCSASEETHEAPTSAPITSSVDETQEVLHTESFQVFQDHRDKGVSIEETIDHKCDEADDNLNHSSNEKNNSTCHDQIKIDDGTSHPTEDLSHEEDTNVIHKKDHFDSMKEEHFEPHFEMDDEFTANENNENNYLSDATFSKVLYPTPNSRNDSDQKSPALMNASISSKPSTDLEEGEIFQDEDRINVLDKPLLKRTTINSITSKLIKLNNSQSIDKEPKESTNSPVESCKPSLIQIKYPSPPRNPISNIIHINNLVRPFTLKQLEDELKKFGDFNEDDFWIDKIKSNCIVRFSSEKDSQNARNALHNLRWPVSNPKILRVDFITQEKMDFFKSQSTALVPHNKPDLDVSITNACQIAQRQLLSGKSSRLNDSKPHSNSEKSLDLQSFSHSSKNRTKDNENFVIKREVRRDNKAEGESTSHENANTNKKKIYIERDEREKNRREVRRRSRSREKNHKDLKDSNNRRCFPEYGKEHERIRSFEDSRRHRNESHASLSKTFPVSGGGLKHSTDRERKRIADTNTREFVNEQSQSKNEQNTFLREWDIGKNSNVDVSVSAAYPNASDANQESRKDKFSDSTKPRRIQSPEIEYSNQSDVKKLDKSKKTEKPTASSILDELFIKTKSAPSVYWKPLSLEDIEKRNAEILKREEDRRLRIEHNISHMPRDKEHAETSRKSDRRKYQLKH